MAINPAVIAASVSYSMMSIQAQYAFVRAARRGAIPRAELERLHTPEAVEEVLAMALAEERNGDVIVHDVLREALEAIKS